MIVYIAPMYTYVEPKFNSVRVDHKDYIEVGRNTEPKNPVFAGAKKL